MRGFFAKKIKKKIYQVSCLDKGLNKIRRQYYRDEINISKNADSIPGISMCVSNEALKQ